MSEDSEFKAGTLKLMQPGMACARQGHDRP